MQMDNSGVSLRCEETEDDHRATGGQLRAAWDPSVSGRRVIQRLLGVEKRYMPSPLYVSLIQREPQRREELVKWMLEVCCNCGCDEAVFPLSVSLMDRFLSVTLSAPTLPRCLAASCILVASKLSECDSITSDALCTAAEYDFLPVNLREMERIVLATLRWDTAGVTPQDFLPHFLSLLDEWHRGDGSTLRRHSDTLVAMCSCDWRFLGATPSLIAAASLNCALRGLGDRPYAVCSMLAELCRAEPVVLEHYSEMIEHALRQRLGSGPAAKGDEMEDERAGTPTDMREIDF
ncbi:cyclin Dx [Corythoichthys intestinalis]|uniref:cyclin Dx n=1 Tax=Corythoichthys intestinalis TaxID=161448 RepID=UPI0025A578D2|nr:cyclin Dx [Corythoichthys intestinalis]XP_061805328.1 G1/S-specific cyclin-D1-like [Nerophis lumbriciformis]